MSIGDLLVTSILKLSTHTEQIFRLLLKISVYGGHLLRLNLFILELPYHEIVSGSPIEGSIQTNFTSLMYAIHGEA